MTTDMLETPPDEMLDLKDKRLADKDQHISTLESELAELRADLRSRTSLEELLTKVTKTPPQDPEPVQGNKDNTEDLDARVRNILQTERAKANRDANIDKSRRALTEKYGDDYNAVLKETAQSLGVAEKWIADMAATSPDGLIALVGKVKGEVKKDTGNTPPASSVDTSKAFNQGTKKNYAFFDAIRKADLTRYLSREVQAEIHEEALRQGAAFYD